MNRYSADHDPRTERRLLIGWWRLGISLVVAIMVCALGALIVTNLRLGEELKSAHTRIGNLSDSVADAGRDSRDRITSLTKDLEETRTTALKPDDLDEFRQDIEERLGKTRTRVTELENQAVSAQEVVASATRSVLFLQGSYQLIDPDTDKPLRYGEMRADGNPVMLAPGIPMLDPDGKGPIYEPTFSGTGFIVSNDGLIMTNRHVALPWEQSQLTSILVSNGIVPRLTQMWGFMPGNEAPFKVTLVKASDEADLALLKCSDVTVNVPALAISQKPVRPGTEVILMGYPTGLRALLARAGEAYRDASIDSGIGSYWDLALRLSKDGLIQPLASRGIVGQTTGAHVVYDAETTSGGSGGPLLTLDGRVVAVNMAILPDFDGSNLGVPSRLILDLIQSSRDMPAQ